MKPLRTNQDILEFAAANAPTNACARSIREGRGVVSALRDEDVAEFRQEETEGWLVKVLNVSHGRCWKIAILCDEGKRKYSVKYLA